MDLVPDPAANDGVTEKATHVVPAANTSATRPMRAHTFNLDMCFSLRGLRRAVRRSQSGSGPAATGRNALGTGSVLSQAGNRLNCKNKARPARIAGARQM